MVAELDERQSRRATSRTAAGSTSNLGGPVLPDKLYFYGSYFRPDHEPRQPRQPLRRAARLREHAQRGLRQADLHADQRDAAQRQLPRLASATDTSDLFASNAVRRPPAAATSRACKIGTAEGSWVINSRSYATVQVHPLRERDAGPARQRRRRRPSRRLGTRLDIDSLDTLGPLTVPAPIAGQTAFNAFIQPLIDRYGYVAERRHARAAAPSATARSSTTTTSSATPARSATT